MRFGLMSGIQGPGSGGIQLSPPNDYWPSEPCYMQPVLLVPLVHIEQIIVLRSPNPSVPKIRAYRIIMVPTAATGSSPIVRQSPDIISFNWPDRKADKHLKGRFGEAADRNKDTYLSVFKRVFDEQLAAFGKSVVGVTDTGEEDQTFSCGTTVCFRKKPEEPETTVRGRVYFLDTGLFFSSRTMRLYLPFESFTNIVGALTRNQPRNSDSFLPPGEKSRPANLEFHVDTSEPYYTKGDASQQHAQGSSRNSTEFIFKRITLRLLDKLKAYASKHGIDFEEDLTKADIHDEVGQEARPKSELELRSKDP